MFLPQLCRFLWQSSILKYLPDLKLNSFENAQQFRELFEPNMVAVSREITWTKKEEKGMILNLKVEPGGNFVVASFQNGSISVFHLKNL